MMVSSLVIHPPQPLACWDYGLAPARTAGLSLSIVTLICVLTLNTAGDAAANPVRAEEKLTRIESEMVWWCSKSRFLFNELFVFY